MTFEFRPAKREAVGLLIGLAGASGSGKTYSALRLATGLADGKKIAVLDTENGRALHYADAFQFDHGELRAPFRPEKYAEAILEADAAGYGCVVVDSISHEHAGEGGLLDWQQEELERMGGQESKKFAAWIKPKMAHKAFVSRLLQVRAHLILCFRAEEKIEIVRKPGGGVEVVPKATATGLDGWIPVSEKNLPYELTISLLLLAGQPGIPHPIKLQEQHRPMVPLDQPLTEATGRALGGWAAGSVSPAGDELELEGLRERYNELAVLLEQEEPATRALEATPRDSAWLRKAIAKAEKALSEGAAVGHDAGSGSAANHGEPERAAPSESASDSEEQSTFADMLPASVRYEDRG